MGNNIEDGVLPTDQRYYDKDYFETGSKKTHDHITGEDRVWGYQGTDWTGNQPVVEGMLNIFNGDIGSVLDVGCGQGSFTDYVLRAGLRARGYDFSTWAVEHPHHLAAGNIFQADVTAGIPEPDESYDLVFCSDMVEHIRKSRIKFVAQELYRVSRRWVFLQFPLALEPAEVFDFEVDEFKPESEYHPWYAKYMITGHLNMEQRVWWDALFASVGFKPREDLVTTFRDCVPKEVLGNWYNILILEKP